MVTQRAFYPFGTETADARRVGVPEVREKRVYLSKSERQCLERAYKILERLREAVDPHQWLEYGGAGDIPERSMIIDCAASYVYEAWDMGEYVVVDDVPQGFVQSKAEGGDA